MEIFSYNGALMTASGSRLYLKGVNWFGERPLAHCLLKSISRLLLWLRVVGVAHTETLDKQKANAGGRI